VLDARGSREKSYVGFEAAEVHEVAVEFVRRHTIADCLGRLRRSFANDRSHFLQKYLRLSRVARDVRIDVFGGFHAGPYRLFVELVRRLSGRVVGTIL
jgi:hypothetical protein